MPTIAVADVFFASPERLLLADRVREAANLAMTRMRDEMDCAAPGFAQLLIQRGH